MQVSECTDQEGEEKRFICNHNINYLLKRINMKYKISKFVAISKLHNPIILHAQVSAGLFLVPLQLHQAGPHHQVPHVVVVGGVVIPGRALYRIKSLSRN